MVSCGIKKSSYRLRTMILKDIFSSKILPNNCILINCEVSIGFLCRNLFQNYPSFKETSKCEKGCPERLKTLPLIQVQLEALLENNFNQIEKDVTIQGFRSCIQPNCDGLESTTISEIGMCMYTCVCVCVCVCVCACARACVRACARVCVIFLKTIGNIYYNISKLF